MVLRVAVASVALMVLESCFQVPRGVGSPMGRSARTSNYIATLIVTQQPYAATLNRNPENDRFDVALLLNPVEDESGGRMIPVSQGLKFSDLRLGTGILGDDGKNLWFVVGGIWGFNLRTEKLIKPGDLADANPGVNGDDVRGYDLGQRLRVIYSDGRVFEIDPGTLRAVQLQGEDARVRARPDPKPQDFLQSGGLVSPKDWFGVHTQAEVERDFKPGSSISRENRAEKSSKARHLYRGRIDPTPYRARVLSLTQLPGEEYLNGALLASAAGSAPMRLSQPDGFLVTYLAKPGGTLLLARVDLDGKRVWTANTGISELDQILPGATSVAFIGKKAPVPDKVAEPVLVVVNNRSGAVSSRSLRR